jgi:predicted nucleic acid-binding protein
VVSHSTPHQKGSFARTGIIGNLDAPICLDSSALVRIVFADIRELVTSFDQAVADERHLLAPSLVHFEVVNALWKYVRAGTIEKGQAQRMIASVLEFPLTLLDDDELHVRAADLAFQVNGLTGYDEHLVAAAERSGAELWTADRRLSSLTEAIGLQARLWST